MNSPGRTQRCAAPPEMRFGERIKLRIPVALETGNGPGGAGTLCDISISGAFIETGLELPEFANLVVSFPAVADSAIPRKLAACVVRHTLAGVGIEWRDMACATLLALLRDGGCDATRVAPCDRAFG